MKTVTEIMVAGKKDEAFSEPTEFECTLYRIVKKKRQSISGTEWRRLFGRIISGEHVGTFSAWAKLESEEVATVADLEVKADQELCSGGTPFKVVWDERKIAQAECEKYGSE
jgi:hypothetical protein